MTVDTIREFIAIYPFLFFPIVFIISYFLYPLTRFVLARSAYRIALAGPFTSDLFLYIL